MADPTCHYCDRPATEECTTCGRLYCQEHGEDVCLRCMSPEAATPSAIVYRGSLLALVIASAVVLFLVVRPPESKSLSSQARIVATPTQQVNPTATPTPPGSQASKTPTAAPTGAGSATAAATATATSAAGAKTYTVKPGDTISSIAVDNNTTTQAILDLNPGVSPNTLGIGTVLKLP
jgi:LysM repeat protein